MRLIQNNVCGENRVVLLDDSDRLSAFYIQREERLNLNEVVASVITQKAPQIGGYFALSDKNESVFIHTEEKYDEGQRINILITKEARMGKDANGRIVAMSPAKAPDIAYLLSRTENLPIEECWDELDLDSRILALLIPYVSLPNGGGLYIERTNVGWTIDVDTGNSDLEATVINRHALKEIARQIKLRGLAGIIVIDFAGTKNKKEQEFLRSELTGLLKKDDRSRVMAFTASKLLEIKRKRMYASVLDVMMDEDKHLTPMTIGYMICRAVLKSRKIMPTIIARPNVIELIREKLKYRAKFQPNLNIEPDFFEIKE